MSPLPSLLDTVCATVSRLHRWMARCLAERTVRQLSIRLASTSQQLAEAEQDLSRQLPPEVHCDVQADVVELRVRRTALLDEWAYWSARHRELAIPSHG